MKAILSYLLEQVHNKKVIAALLGIVLAGVGIAQTDPLYENIVYSVIGLLAVAFPKINSPETEARNKEEKQ